MGLRQGTATLGFVLAASAFAACSSDEDGKAQRGSSTNDADAGEAPGDGSQPSPNLLPQDELFQCNGQVSDAPGRLRRLNRWQWTRNVGGAVTRDWTGFSFYDNPFDPSQGELYSTYATDESLDEATIELFLPVVTSAGPQWAGPYAGDNRLERLRTDESLRCMFEDEKPQDTCLRHYLSEFLLHGVYFRPATTKELDRLAQFAGGVLAEEPAGGGADARTASITRISTAAWMTTGALFRSELGSAPEAGLVPLDDWELAQQLAYAVGSRAPGATPTWIYPDFSAPADGHLADVAAAATDGSIRDPSVIANLFSKNAGGTDEKRFDLIQDWNEERRMRRGQYWLADGVAGFFREWLGYAHVNEVFKDTPAATSRFEGGPDNEDGAWENHMSAYYGYEPTLIQQLDDMIARVVMADADVLKNLLTTRQFYLAAPMEYAKVPGHVYNFAQDIPDERAARWVTLPANERAGVLTHPAWLAAHGGNFEDDPSIVHRGKWVQENLLCGYVPPLGAVRVQAVVGDHDPRKSARVRLAEAVSKPGCSGCHDLMNPLGYPFEIYNHAGYLRVKDHSPTGGFSAPDGSSVLANMPDATLDGNVRDAVELVEKLATSNHAKRCFLRQAFRYYMGRNENQTDACALAAMEKAYDANKGSFFKAVSALMTTDAWTKRQVGAGQ